MNKHKQKIVDSMMDSTFLEVSLCELIRDILAGNTARLPELQQRIRYAPLEMQARMLRYINA